jgi:hypothetical protein
MTKMQYNKKYNAIILVNVTAKICIFIGQYFMYIIFYIYIIWDKKNCNVILSIQNLNIFDLKAKDFLFYKI